MVLPRTCRLRPTRHPNQQVPFLPQHPTLLLHMRRESCSTCLRRMWTMIMMMRTTLPWTSLQHRLNTTSVIPPCPRPDLLTLLMNVILIRVLEVWLPHNRSRCLGIRRPPTCLLRYASVMLFDSPHLVPFQRERRDRTPIVPCPTRSQEPRKQTWNPQSTVQRWATLDTSASRPTITSGPSTVTLIDRQRVPQLLGGAFSHLREIDDLLEEADAYVCISECFCISFVFTACFVHSYCSTLMASRGEVRYTPV